MFLIRQAANLWQFLATLLSRKKSLEVISETSRGQSDHIRRLADRQDQLHERIQQAEKSVAERERDDSRRQLAGAMEEVILVREGWSKTLAELAQVNRTGDHLQGQIQLLNRRVNQALKLEGQIWTQETIPGTPAFRDLAERRTPIVSVLNLKGGVGKTTSTAYWASACVRQRMRMLLVDFDLQGSLSSLFVKEGELARRDREGRHLLRHYLEATTRDPDTPFLDYATPIFDGRSALVGTTDRLAYSEINLTFRWMMRAGRPGQRWDGGDDVRFLLRRGLHQPAVAGKFDLVLLDCPPLINLSCVNALAASDYVLIPVNPSRKAVERIPPLLRRLRELRQSLHPELKILGMLAVRTHKGDGFTAVERDMFQAMLNLAKDAWGEPVELFDTMIPNRAKIRDAEESFGNGQECEEVQSAFEQLAMEATKRMPAYAQPNSRTERDKVQS